MIRILPFGEVHSGDSVNVCPADMGFKKGATTKEVLKRLSGLGYPPPAKELPEQLWDSEQRISFTAL